jgi:CBS domain-containing protein
MREESDVDSIAEGGGPVSGANGHAERGHAGTANGHVDDGGSLVAVGLDRWVVPRQARPDHAPRPRTSTPVALMMSTAAPTVRADAQLASAIELFLVSRCRHMLVLHADGTCAGVVNDRDVLVDWPLDAERLSARQVRHVMSHVTPMVDSRCPMSEVARLMSRYLVEAVAVVDEVGRPVGLVTSSEIVSLVASMPPDS